MDISITIPSGLVDASNGRFVKKTDLGDGYTRWDWAVHYPINSYDVSINVNDYVHFTDKLGDVTLDFYVTAGESREGQDRSSRRPSRMIEAFEHFFGEYPFAKDGYKLIAVPYTGMEHQSAVTYGNGFRNGYGAAATGRASASARSSTSSSSTRAATSGSATPCRRPTSPTCGFRKAGAPTSRACTWSTPTGKPTA